MSGKKPSSKHPWRKPLNPKTAKPKQGNKLPKAKLSPVAPPETSFKSDQLDTFLYLIKERHLIHLLKESNILAPWTRDSILQSTFFCNPYKELDKTTRWFADNLRNPLKDSPLVILATVAFRWFNFIPTGELLSEWEPEEGSITNLFTDWDSGLVRHILHTYSEDGNKVFTGAYIIKSPNGQNKIDGICDCIDIVARCLNQTPSLLWDTPEQSQLPAQYSPQEVQWDEGQDESRVDFLTDLLNGELSLQEAHQGFMLFPFLGDFMSFELVSDLRYTKYLCDAPDIMTWTNLGPGAIRGILRLIGQFTPGPANGSYRAPQNGVELCQELLEICQATFGSDKRFPPFEMCEVEKSLCEYDKYARVLNQEGPVKRLYDGSGR